MADHDRKSHENPQVVGHPDQPCVGSTHADVARDLVRTESFAAADKVLARTIEWVSGVGPWARDRVQAFMARFAEALDARGAEPKEIPERVGVPVLQAAALEDREEMRELWANLLVSAATGAEIDHFTINIVKQLSPDAARYLLLLQKFPDPGRRTSRLFADRASDDSGPPTYSELLRAAIPTVERERLARSRVSALGLVSESGHLSLVGEHIVNLVSGPP